MEENMQTSSITLITVQKQVLEISMVRMISFYAFQAVLATIGAGLLALMVSVLYMMWAELYPVPEGPVVALIMTVLIAVCFVLIFGYLFLARQWLLAKLGWDQKSPWVLRLKKR